MCKRKDKKKPAKNAAVVGTSASITGKTVGNAKVVTQVKPPGSVNSTPSSVSTGSINPKVTINAPPKKAVISKSVLTGLDIILKVLNGLRIAAITIGIILGLFTILGLIYAYLAITGVVEPDPQAFFDNIKFWNH